MVCWIQIVISLENLAKEFGIFLKASKKLRFLFGIFIFHSFFKLLELYVIHVP